MMIPLYTVLVPLVQLSKNLGLMNSEIGLCIIYMGTYMPFAVFLFVGFIKGIPNEIIEAATIDGCTVFKTFWVIVFPLLKPIVATMFILDFLGTWNQFLLPLLSLSDPSKQTVTLAMYAFFSGYGAQWQLAFAGYIIALSPLVVIYLFLQRYIVKGIMTGAVKG
jgi:raffinose/stachyose/melibiose transport system permease protein